MSFAEDLDRYLRKLDSFWMEDPDTHGGWWRNEHLFPDAAMRGINLGSAGIVISLLALQTRVARKSQKMHIESYLQKAVRWLKAITPSQNSFGFFTGDAGIALAVYCYGRCLNDSEMIKWSIDQIKNCLQQIRLTDFFSGLAGVIFAATIVLEAERGQNGSGLQNEVSSSLARLLKEITSISGVIGIPDSHVDNDTTDIFIGAAHGSIGLYLTLHRCGQVLASPELLQLAETIRTSILENGRLKNSSSLRYRSQAHYPANNLNWCHGVEGLLWADLITKRYTNSIANTDQDWILERVISQRRYDNTTLCHGIAGRLAVLLHLLEVKESDSTVRAEVVHDLSTLEILQQRSATDLCWSSDDVFFVTPDLWVGFSGTFLTYCNAKYNWEMPLILSPEFFFHLFRSDFSQG